MTNIGISYMLNSWQLIVLGVALLLAPKFLHFSDASTDWSEGRIKRALARVISLTGVAALIAAALLLFTGQIIAASYQHTTLLAISEAIEYYNALSDYFWIVFLAAIVLLTLVAGSVLVPAAKARRLVESVKLSGKIKYIVVLLASCSFVQGGALRQIDEQIAKEQSAARELTELQMALFQKVKQTTQQQLISDAVQNLSAEEPLVEPVIEAYDRLHGYYPEYIKKVVRAELPQRAFEPIADFERSDAESLLKQYGGGTKEQFVTTPEDNVTTRNFVEDVAGIVYDNSVSESIKSHMLGIENPLVSELVSAFLDPLIFDGLKVAAADLATRAMQSRWNPDELRAQIRRVASTQKSAVVARAAKVARQASKSGREVGEPVWNDIRSKLSLAVRRGLSGKDEQTQNEAREAVARFDEFWLYTERIYGNGPTRTAVPEQLFQRYLFEHEPYAALWGYAVIAFVPPELEAELSDISMQHLMKSSGIEKIRSIQSLASDSSAEAKELLSGMGLQGLPEKELTVERVAKAFHAYKGAYPADGFTLYFKKTSPGSYEGASEYYDSHRVAKHVGKFCPKKPPAKAGGFKSHD